MILAFHPLDVYTAALRVLIEYAIGSCYKDPSSNSRTCPIRCFLSINTRADNGIPRIRILSVTVSTVS